MLNKPLLIAITLLLTAALACTSTVNSATPTHTSLTIAASLPTVVVTPLTPADTQPPVGTPSLTPTVTIGGELIRNADGNWQSLSTGGQQQLIWLYERDFDTQCLLVVRTSNTQLQTQIVFNSHRQVWGTGAFARTFTLPANVTRLTITLSTQQTPLLSLRCNNINFAAEGY